MSKVIFDPTSEEAKALIGKEVEFSNYYDFSSKRIDILKEIDTTSNLSPFTMGNDKWFTFIRALPEPTYAERQAKWEKETGAKKGTKVKITRHFKDKEDGCDCMKSDMNGKRNIVGAICEIQAVLEESVMINAGTRSYWAVPFTALEIVRETYRPYTNEEMKGLYGKTLMDKNGLPSIVTAIRLSCGIVCISLGGWQLMSAQQLFESNITIDGHKCGVLV